MEKRGSRDNGKPKAGKKLTSYATGGKAGGAAQMKRRPHRASNRCEKEGKIETHNTHLRAEDNEKGE